MTLTIGLGCRRGVSEARIAAALRRAAACLLQAQPIWASMPVSQVATIDAKRSESGLLAYCTRRALPLRFATAEDLAALSQRLASAPSRVVLARFGVPGVCEAAALWASRLDARTDTDTDTSSMLVLSKQVWDGVTVAMALHTPAATVASGAPSAADPSVKPMCAASFQLTITLDELAHTDENRS